MSSCHLTGSVGNSGLDSCLLDGEGSNYLDVGTSVASTIGSASAAYAVGDARIFVVDDAIGSAIFRFVSADTDAAVEANELTLLGVVDTTSALATTDFGLFA